MPPSKLIYTCTQCGYQSRKWLGRCPSCNEWNSFVEEAAQDKPKAAAVLASPAGAAPQRLPEVSKEDFERCHTGIGELDRVLGGGIVQGCLVLIGGDPGIGKSTLLLQAMECLARQGHSVLYVSGEESMRQVALRAGRLGAKSPNLYLYSETNMDRIVQHIQSMQPEFVVVDSIQTVYCPQTASAPGSVSQVRDAASALMQLAKGGGPSIFVVGHVTKAGSIAGPRVLEHMVDTVLYFEGDADHAYRILRAVKNRFGSTSEIGIFEMRGDGMAEVPNPSEMFLSTRGREAPGAVVTASMEGSRPVLVEIQSLVCSTVFGNPRRQAAGVDYNRMVLLCAVLEKRAGVRLADQDVYVNVSGGLRLVEPAIDLAVAVAMASSFKAKVLPPGTAVFGEISLTGEIRPVPLAELRLQELARTGFERVLLPARTAKQVQAPAGLKVIGVANIAQALVQLEEV